MLNLILIVLVYCVSELLDSQMDTLQFEPSKAWFSYKWYLCNDHQTTNWFKKVSLSFLMGGWHGIKALRILTIDILVAILIQPYLHITFILIVLGLYIIHGIAWQTFYGRKFHIKL